MKVTRNTPEQLIVADVPWLIAIMLVLFVLVFVGIGLALVAGGEWFGLIFALGGGGMGLVALAVFVQRVQVIFDRPSNALIMRKRTVLGYSEVRHNLSDVTKAVLETTRNSKGQRMSRPSLVLGGGMSAGVHPIVSVYTNTRGPSRVVKAVNDWLGQFVRVDNRAATP